MAAQKLVARRTYQRTIPVFLVSLLIGIFLVEYFFAYEPLTGVTEELSQWGVVITTGTLLFGSVMTVLVKVRGLTIKKRTRKEYFDIVVFLFAVGLFIIIGLIDPENTHGVIFLAIYTPLMSMIGRASFMNIHMYYVWAVVQSLAKVRSLEVLVLAVSTLLIIFYNTPVTIAAIPQLHPLGEWIVTVLNASVQKATAACLAVGGIVVMVRAVSGREPGLIEMEMD